MSAYTELDLFSVTYPTFRLEPLSLAVDRGERVAIVGPNGSGKSTTLKAVAGRLPDYEGAVRLNGALMRDQLPGVRQMIGYLPEALLGFGWMSIQDHIELLRHFYSRWDAGYAAALMHRLDLPSKAKLGTLSKGMRVKLSFVTAEAYRPPLLVLDEPTSGLDPLVRRELIDIILESVANEPERIVLFSTHILEDVEWIAERVIVLKDGRLKADASVDELRSRSGGRPISEALYSILSDDERRSLSRAP